MASRKADEQIYRFATYLEARAKEVRAGVGSDGGYLHLWSIMEHIERDLREERKARGKQAAAESRGRLWSEMKDAAKGRKPN